MLRYPEKELVCVPAHRTYYEPAKPLAPAQSAAALSQQHEPDEVLDIDGLIGKRIIETRLHRNLTIREENAIAALEVMSRFATNPKGLIYLPPPCGPPELTADFRLDSSDRLRRVRQSVIATSWHYLAAVTMISIRMPGCQSGAPTQARTGGFCLSTQSFQTEL